MKLTTAIVAAFAMLIYAIMKAYAPQLPFTLEQVSIVIYLALAWLGVTVSESVIRSLIVKRGPPAIARLFERK